MLLNRDFGDLLAALDAAGVEYSVVGADSLPAHGHVRATQDLDVWVRPSAENAVPRINGELTIPEVGRPESLWVPPEWIKERRRAA